MYELRGKIEGRDVCYRLGPGRHRIGRGSRNDIAIEDRSISREHAEILVDEQTARIQDLGSSNGTWINGSRASEIVELESGDEVRFASLAFTFIREGASDTDIVRDADPELTVALLSEQEEVSTGERLAWDDSHNVLDLPGVFDQQLFAAVIEASQLLVLPGPLEEIFDKVLRIVERVIPARRILLLMTDTPDGSPVIRASRPPGRQGEEKLILSRTILRTVIEERQALLLNDVMSDARFASQDSVIRQNLRSAMVAPLFDNEQVIGLLYADSDDIRFRYGRNQLRAFNFLANLIAVKISNWQLLQMKQDLDAAVRIVNEMLSTRLPFLPGYDISTRQVPCFEVAGDLFDVAPLGDGRVGIVVGDVTGKGLGAATLMSSTLAALRVLFPEYPDPKMMAEKLHRQLLRATDDIHFVTMFIGLLDPDSNRLEYVNAGHNPPMVICDEKKCRTLPTTGMPLGLVAGAKYTAESIELTPGALMCVFTDGVTEAMVGDDIYGEERLQRSVEDRIQLPVSEIAKGVIEDLRAFLGDEALQDDATMLLLRRQK